MSYEGAFHTDNWHREARSLNYRNGIKTRRWGMRVTVYTGADSGDYVLTYGLNSTDIQDNDNWLKVADIGQTWGGGGGGVNIYNSDGTLTGDRVLDGDGFNLSFELLNELSISTSDNTSVYAEGTINIHGEDDVALTSGQKIEIIAATSLLGQGEHNIRLETGLGDPDAPGLWLDQTGDITGTPYSAIMSVGDWINTTDNYSWSQILQNSVTLYSEDIVSGDYADFSISNAGGGQINGYATEAIELTGEHSVKIYGINNVFIDSDVDIALSSEDITLSGITSAVIQSENFIQLISQTQIDFSFDSSGYLTLDGDWGTDGYVLTTHGPSGPPTWEPAGGGGGVSADNGLTETSGNIQLGGELLKYTFIDGLSGPGGPYDFGIGAQNLAFTNDNGNGIEITASDTVRITVPGGLELSNGYGNPGDVITSQGSGDDLIWAPVGGGGGITNTAANTELGMSDGTNIVPSGLFMTSVGQTMAFGSSSIGGSDRAIVATGSGSNISLTLTPKGTSNVQINSATANFGTSTLSGADRELISVGSATNISLTLTPKGSSRVQVNSAALNMGISSLAGATRTIQAQGSASDIGMTLIAKGQGQFIFTPQNNSTSGAGAVFVYSGSGVVVNDNIVPTYQTQYRPDGILGINVNTKPTSFKIQSNDGITTTSPNAVLFEIVSGFGHATDGNGGRIYIHTGGGAGAGVGGALDIEAAVGGAASFKTNNANLTISAQGSGYLILQNLPTSAAGLPSGALWNNGGVLNIA